VASTTWELAPAQVATGPWLRPIAPRVLLVALAVLTLNLVDGFATLRHLQLGAIEVNPLMRALLARGPITFLLGKHLLASIGVIGIVAHSQHRPARILLYWGLLPVYAAIATYQVALFFVI
jgi:hypothetical protein